MDVCSDILSMINGEPIATKRLANYILKQMEKTDETGVIVQETRVSTIRTKSATHRHNDPREVRSVKSLIESPRRKLCTQNGVYLVPLTWGSYKVDFILTFAGGIFEVSITPAFHTMYQVTAKVALGAIARAQRDISEDLKSFIMAQEIVATGDEVSEVRE